MSRASIPAAEWIAEHEQHYSTLFDDGFIQDEAELVHMPNGTIALSALMRFSRKSNKLSRNFKVISTGVTSILQACFDDALGDRDALLRTMPAGHLPALQKIVTDTIDRWERGCLQWRYPSPFCDNPPAFRPALGDVSADLVLLTTAAFVQMEPNILNGKPLPAWAKNGVQLYGPRFTENLLEGKPLPYHPIDEFTTHPDLDVPAKQDALAHYPMPVPLRIALRDLAAEAALHEKPEYPDLDAL